jgi:hypothetical protein
VSIFNEYGTVHVIADVNGYYESHDHDDRYYPRAETDTKLAAAIATPNHVTGAQIADGTVGLTDLLNTGNFLNYTIPVAVTVPASGCTNLSLSLGSSAGFRLIVPFRLGAGITNSALLSASPVVMNASGDATLEVCNRGGTFSASAFSFIVEYKID